MIKLKLKGFTLVELIIVIAILVILATIAFISYEGYTKNARDAVRLTHLKDISKGINSFFLKTGKVPNVDNQYATGVISGDVLNYVGYIGKNVSRQLNMSEIPKDPLTGNNYVYGIDVTKKKFQVAGVKEEGLVSKLEGNYNGLLKISTGGVLKLYNIPSLIFVGSGNLLSSESYFIAEGSKNIAYSLDNNILNNSQEPNTVLQFLTQNPQASITGVVVPRDINSYSGSTFESVLGYSSDIIGISLYGNEYLTSNNNTDSNNTPTTPSCATIPTFANIGITTAGTPTSINQAWTYSSTPGDCTYTCTGGYTGSDCSVAPVYTCATQPTYSNATFTAGTPTNPNQVWQNTNNTNPCYYTCTGGYTGSDCSVAPVLTCADSTVSQYMCANTVTSQFVDNGNGTITDNVTGLMWEQDGSTTATWTLAKTDCANSTLGGHTDWRLPDITELFSIADYSRINPSIDTSKFTSTANSNYWSSTTYSSNASNAWIVFFSNAYSDSSHKTNGDYVRCVR